LSNLRCETKRTSKNEKKKSIIWKAELMSQF
jgi:hypothetical protein